MTKKHSSQSVPLPAKAAIAVCSFELSGSGDAAMQLFPAGTFDAPRGALRGKGPWRLDAAAAQRLIATVARRSNDIVIDYEHQSLLTAQNGKPVVAAGWIGPQTLEWREPPAAHPGLFALNPKFTAAASGHIAADEIRYVSPVFSYDAKTGEVLDIINVALTNNPAIDGMQAVTVAAANLLAANTLLNPTESIMDIEELLEQLRWMFNLPTLATLDEIKAELDKAKALLSSNAADAAATSLIDHLTAKNAEIAALTTQVSTATAHISLTPDPAKYVPIEVVNELNGKLAALSGDTVDMQIEKLIEDGVKTGRIIGAASKQWLTDMGKKDIAALQGYLDVAQPIAALSGMQTTGKKPPAADDQLSDEELAVCRQMQIDPEAYKQSLKN
ncbi:MAG TPA: phage protease [Methylobacter sp.]